MTFPKLFAYSLTFDCLHTRCYGEKKQTDYQISLTPAPDPKDRKAIERLLGLSESHR